MNHIQITDLDFCENAALSSHQPYGGASRVSTSVSTAVKTSVSTKVSKHVIGHSHAVGVASAYAVAIGGYAYTDAFAYADT
jgi:hypothetical protein